MEGTPVVRLREYYQDPNAPRAHDVLPAASAIAVQIAHLTGGGTYDDPATDDALSVFVDAIARKDPRMERVYFDISGIAGFGKWTDHAGQIAARIRQIGIQRVIYGSDGALGGGLAPRDAWANVLKLPLTDEEFRTIAANVAPYMR